MSQSRNLEEAMAIDYAAVNMNLKRFLKAWLQGDMRWEFQLAVILHTGAQRGWNLPGKADTQ